MDAGSANMAAEPELKRTIARDNGELYADDYEKYEQNDFENDDTDQRYGNTNFPPTQSQGAY